jgi:hypothetical protein
VLGPTRTAARTDSAIALTLSNGMKD